MSGGINRREFIKACLAAAVVANVPFTEAEAVEAYEAFGIEDVGNGWYRCWMSFDGETLSTHAKAGEDSHMQLGYKKVRAWFDLETGTLGRMEIVEEESEPTIKTSGPGDLTIWGAQLES